MTTILICDERRDVREGLTRATSSAPHVTRIDAVAAVEDLLRHMTRNPADIVLVGARTGRSGDAAQVPGRMPVATDLVGVVRRVLELRPQTRVLVFGGAGSAAEVALVVAAGGCGFLRWHTTRPPGAATSLADLPADPGGHAGLTERERQVLLGMSQGKTNSEIGRELYLAEDTVKTHARRLFRKLGVHDRAQAVAHAFRLRLVT